MQTQPALEELKRLSMSVETRYEHIVRDEHGIPMISGTMIKVVEVVLDYLTHGWSPEEIYLQHKPYLTMGQIHSALGFYWDNKAEIDEDIRRRDERVTMLRQAAPPNPHLERIRATMRTDAR